MKKGSTRITALLAGILLLGAALLGAAGCGITVKAENLMKDIAPGKAEEKTADNAFVQSMANFAVGLFQKTANRQENTLLSPLSVMMALAMTANGADTQTLAEMEQVLGGGMPIEELNKYLYAYGKGLPSEKGARLQLANSIWFREQEELLQVEKEFLQTNADYYQAAAYRSPFDAGTVRDINNWVKKSTDGLIEEILQEIDEDVIMYLVNALAFEAEWQTNYEKNQIFEGNFTAANGEKRAADLMRSKEARYIDDGRATGFIKDYKGGHYSFAALLPNEEVPIEEYIASLSGEGLLAVIKNAEAEGVEAILPKFSYAYTVEMNDALRELGMPTAFDRMWADFSRLGHASDDNTESGGADHNLSIGQVLHKTFITVDERGTKAGAATKVEIVSEGVEMLAHTVKLDRPFVYMILENGTGLPIFIGAVMDIGK